MNVQMLGNKEEALKYFKMAAEADPKVHSPVLFVYQLSWEWQYMWFGIAIFKVVMSGRGSWL
jgi:hypothetical protein